MACRLDVCRGPGRFESELYEGGHQDELFGFWIRVAIMFCVVSVQTCLSLVCREMYVFRVCVCVCV
jgi:hypothetical protein